MEENGFGAMMFNDEAMRRQMPEADYKAFRETIARGMPLTIGIANAVAAAMKAWALEKGATHFTHWFQPMTGMTAEKHESFLAMKEGGRGILEFSGRELIKGEADASSFPSGGLRATFEARGYTAWDPTSYAFIKDETLFIPTAFCSFGGEALDMKTPLLRSMEAINTQALRVLRLFGNENVHRVIPTVGAEQEYFLVDKSLFDRRKDLIFTGRTLFGAMPPKDQEMEHHYYGAIRPRVKAFMQELNRELWALGVPAKTEHNEAAPAQHELANLYDIANIATDHNQLTMERMKVVAERHGLVCLLHEKPFAGVNGSGKHNNWSLATDTGTNLLEPGKTPHENAQFLLFLCAVIHGVDVYQEQLRACVATAGNDHRLGADEAPPAIISLFLGDELTEVLKALESKSEYDQPKNGDMEIGVPVLPRFARDATDRNRTSPFAFTGNKFEFRMPGAAMSVAHPNIVLNTIVADALMRFADELEQKKDNFHYAVYHVIRRTIRNHGRIIFNGNNYGEAWLQEAQKRGLSHLRTTADALPALADEKAAELFTRHGVFSRVELASRYEILMENYVQIIRIEAKTMLEMGRSEILPAALKYTDKLTRYALSRKALLGAPAQPEEKLTARLAPLNAQLYQDLEALDDALARADRTDELDRKAARYRDEVLPLMGRLRESADALEELVSKEDWPYPTYSQLLFSL